MIFLRDRGYEVSIICNPGDHLKNDTITPDGFFVKAIPFPSSITPWQDIQTLFKLWRYMREEKFQIVHTHVIKPGLLGRIAARMAGVPVVLHTVHGFYFHEQMSAAATKFFSAIERLGAMFCDLILSQNRGDINRAINMGICKPDKIKFLGNGIDIDRFHPSRAALELVKSKREELGIRPGKKIVCMIARLVRQKGYHDFFKAARILKDKGFPAVFLAIGQRHYKKGGIDPMGLIKKMGLDEYVIFLGERDDIPDLLAATDLIVLPSWGAEGIPRVLMEAAALGKVAVATDVCGIREAVVHGETGCLVPIRDPKRLAEAIEVLLSSPKIVSRMGLAARRRAENRFDERLYFEKTDEFYRHLLGTKALKLSKRQLNYLKENV
jgi:glycosyltransferase involved in cell wall biosynthesis